MAILMAFLRCDCSPPCVIDRQDHWLQFEPLDDVVQHVLAKFGQRVPQWLMAVMQKLQKRGR